MSFWVPILIQLAYITVNTRMAHHQAYEFDVLSQTIDHTHKAIAYGIMSVGPLIGIVWFGWQAFWLWAAVLTMHFPVFSISLNLFRHKAWDYRNTTDPNGSKIDKWLGKYYDEAIFVSVAVWVFLQFLIFKK